MVMEQLKGNLVYFSLMYASTQLLETNCSFDQMDLGMHSITQSILTPYKTSVFVFWFFVGRFWEVLVTMLLIMPIAP